MKRACCAVALALAAGPGVSAAEVELFDAQGILGGEFAGSAVAISNDTVVLGALGTSGGGAAFVFVKSGGAWSLQQRLVPGDAGGAFGAAVSIHGDEIAVGAPLHTGGGAVYTFRRNGGTWTQDATVLQVSNTSGFGRAVSIEGGALAVGAPFENVGSRIEQGVVYAYTNDGSGWVLPAGDLGRIVERKGSARGGDHIGWSVSLSGNTILAGAPDDDRGNKRSQGSVWIYAKVNTVWTRQARINPGGQTNDRAGSAVALFSNLAVFGANGHKVGNNLDQGIAYTYSRDTLGAWSPTGSVTASDGAEGDRFGSSVAVSGPLKLIGAPQATGTGRGKSYLFGTGNASLGQLAASNGTEGDNFATAVSIDAGSALVGAPGRDPDAKTDAGSGYVFEGLVASTTTAITGINGAAPPADNPSDAGAPYDVSVKVTPAPSAPRVVDVSDGDGATCSPSITLNAAGEGSCQLTSVSPGPHTITAVFLGNDVFSGSQATASHRVQGGDLAVTKDDDSDKVVAGETKVYKIVVSNPGDFAAVGVALTDNLPAQLTNASWVCVSDAVGAVCPVPANGMGSIVGQSVDLLSGTSVTFTLTATVVDPLLADFIDNTATIAVGANVDANPDNNSSTDTDDKDLDALFSDSFEDPPAP